jgi:hypothetical protein
MEAEMETETWKAHEKHGIRKHGKLELKARIVGNEERVEI